MDKTCTLLLLRRDGEILLAKKKRGFGVGLWNGVGGKIEPGETIEEALVRETQEEIGVTPTTYHKVAEHDFVMDADSDHSWHMYVHAYIADAWDGDPVESEEMAPQWFQLSDIPYDNMWQDDVYWMPALLGGQQLKTRFTFAGDDTLLTAEMTPVASF